MLYQLSYRNSPEISGRFPARRTGKSRQPHWACQRGRGRYHTVTGSSAAVAVRVALAPGPCAAHDGLEIGALGRQRDFLGTARGGLVAARSPGRRVRRRINLPVTFSATAITLFTEKPCRCRRLNTPRTPRSARRERGYCASARSSSVDVVANARSVGRGVVVAEDAHFSARRRRRVQHQRNEMRLVPRSSPRTLRGSARVEIAQRGSTRAGRAAMVPTRGIRSKERASIHRTDSSARCRCSRSDGHFPSARRMSRRWTTGRIASRRPRWTPREDSAADQVVLEATCRDPPSTRPRGWTRRDGSRRRSCGRRQGRAQRATVAHGVHDDEHGTGRDGLAVAGAGVVRDHHTSCPASMLPLRDHAADASLHRPVTVPRRTPACRFATIGDLRAPYPAARRPRWSTDRQPDGPRARSRAKSLAARLASGNAWVAGPSRLVNGDRRVTMRAQG